MIMKFSGFSLVELMVVIAIIAVLSSVAIVSYRNSAINAKLSTVIQTLQGFEPAIDAYYLRTNSWAAQANDVLPGSSTLGVQFPDNAKIANVNLSSINFASAQYACSSIPGGLVVVGQVIAYLDSTAFPSGSVAPTSAIQLVRGTTKNGVTVSAGGCQHSCRL